jgi:hypothetical protein
MSIESDGTTAPAGPQDPPYDQVRAVEREGHHVEREAERVVGETEREEARLMAYTADRPPFDPVLGQPTLRDLLATAQYLQRQSAALLGTLSTDAATYDVVWDVLSTAQSLVDELNATLVPPPSMEPSSAPTDPTGTPSPVSEASAARAAARGKAARRRANRAARAKE